MNQLGRLVVDTNRNRFDRSIFFVQTSLKDDFYTSAGFLFDNVNVVKFDPSTLHLISMTNQTIVNLLYIWKKFVPKINMHIKTIIRICARV